MLSLKQQIGVFLFVLALVTTTSASAALYGFTLQEEQPLAEKLRVPPRRIPNYRKDMRDLFVSLAEYGKSHNKNFQILAHEGQYLLNKSLWEYHRDNYNKIRNNSKLIDDDSFLNMDVPESDEETPLYVDHYTALLDGIVVNNHYCGEKPLDSTINTYELPIFSIEHCADEKKLDKAIIQSLADKNVIYPFLYLRQAFKRLVHQLIINESANSIFTLKDARNIGFILDDDQYEDAFMVLNEIRNSNYDVIVIHPFFHKDKPYTKEDVEAMKFKKNGGRRLILAQYNISETSEQDYFWKKKWLKQTPEWFARKSPTNPLAYVVKYWSQEWKEIAAHYFKGIIDSGYDGVFITGLENHIMFEHSKPLE